METVFTNCDRCNELVEVGTPCVCHNKEIKMSDNTHSQNAAVLVGAAHQIIEAVQSGQGTTQFIAALLGELVGVFHVGQYVVDLPEEERVEFFGEVWDQAIGIEPTALVNSIGPIGPDTLEVVSDLIKEVVVDLMAKKLEG